jgi:polysaccharide biosynthesis transport protein
VDRHQNQNISYVPVTRLPHQGKEPGWQESQFHYPPLHYLPSNSMQTNNMGGAEQKSLWDFAKVIFKYRKLIIACSFVAFAIALAYSLFARRYYSATATLRIDTYLPIFPGTAREDVLRQQTSEESYFATQVADLKSLPLADKILTLEDVNNAISKVYGAKLQSLSDKEKQEVKAQSPDDVASKYSHPASALDGYLSLIKISPVRETSLVKISTTTLSPKLSALIANTHAEQFIIRQSSERVRGDRENIKFLKTQLADLSQKLIDSEDSLSEYARQHALVSMESDDKITINQVDSVSRLFESATAKRIEAENRFIEAKRALDSGSTGVDDSSIIQLRQELARAQSEYIELGQRFTPEYPKMKELRSRIEGLKREISSQRRGALRALEADFNAAKKNEEQLKEQVDLQKKSAFKVAKAQVEYNRMKRQYESWKELHQNVVRQLQQTEISSVSNQRSNVVLVEPAVVPNGPSSPQPLMALAFALAAGPFIGISIAFLLDALDKTVKNPEELEDLSRAPGLGIVPHFDLSSKKSENENDLSPVAKLYPLVTLQRPFSISSEAFRTIRAGMRLSAVDRPVEVILVTSSDEEEGKSTLVANLGVVCAQDNARTILIDADLRRPSLFKYFDVSEEDPGLAEVLTDQCKLDEVLRVSKVDNLAILPAGGAVPNPAELVGSKKMEALINSLKENFDYILIDTPPIMAVADGLILSRASDGVIVVARANKTLRDHARLSLNRLIEGGARILGVVLNDVVVEPGMRNEEYLSRARANPRFGSDKKWESKASSQNPNGHAA